MKKQRRSGKIAQYLIDLPMELAEDLQLVADRHGMSPHCVCSEVVTMWVESRQLVPVPIGPLTFRQAETVELRRKILVAWRYRLGRRRGSHDAATTRFLAELRRVTGYAPSRATLYTWARRDLNRGIYGLIDGRSKFKG